MSRQSESWKTVRLGDVTRERKLRNEGLLDGGSLYGVSNVAGMTPMRDRVRGPSVDRCKVVQPNCFAYNPMRLNIGSIAMWKGKEPVLVSPDYVVFDTDREKLDSNYLECFRKGEVWGRFVERAGAGSVRVRIYFHDLSQLQFPLPTLGEQRKIAAILSSIDETIENTEVETRQIQFVKDSLLRNLMTGGSDVRRTEQGDLPTGWRSQRLRDDVELVSGQHILAEDCRADGVGMPYLTGPSDFRRGHPVTSKWTEHPKVTCKSGDILLTVKGSGTGKLAVADKEYCISRQLMALRPRSWDSGFLHQFLLTVQDELQRVAAGLIPGLGRDEILEIVAAIPPLTEQRKIVSILRSADDAVEAFVEKTEGLRKVKTALASCLLSGEIRITPDEAFA